MPLTKILSLGLGTNVGGKILQVVYSELTTAVTFTDSSFADIGLSASITPTASSSKLLIIPQVNMSIANNGSICQMDITDSSNNSIINHTSTLSSRVKGIGQLTATGSALGFNTMQSYGQPIQIDASNTSARTYKIRVKRDGATITINSTGSDTDNASHTRGISTITIMEIAS